MHRLFPALVAAACFAATPEKPLEGLRPSHPRLIALDSDIARVRGLLKSDPQFAARYAACKAGADRVLGEAPVVHRLIGPRLLDQSRKALDRIYTLAFVYRVSGERQYLDRAVKELRAAAAFPDWNPKHFLDTAEMTHAFAIGYDWLYPALSEGDRSVIRKAIVEKGLDQGIPIYKENRWWAKAVHNWNQVCNGGMAIGALAVAGEEPERAAYILRRSVESIKLAMNSYAPDGGWAEGPGYWHYATRYNVYYLAALETALGTDFGLSAMPGFSKTGEFRIYFQGPTGYTFNYADAGAGRGSAEEMFWLARKFSNPVYAWDEMEHLRDSSRVHPLDLLWYVPRAVNPKEAGWPLARMFRGVNVGFLRSAWDGPNAVWMGIKGGDNKANHSHLDLGSFVLEADGVRWAMDLGSDDYNMPGYFGAQRWTYYRLKTESHNTVLIDGENQDPKAEAPMSVIAHTLAVDLSKAYPGKLTRWVRQARMADRSVIVRDVLEAPAPVQALWGMVTDADISLHDGSAELKKQGAALQARILSPEGARFEVLSASAPPPQKSNTGAKKLVVRLPGKVTNATIEVSLTPLAVGTPADLPPSPRRRP